MRKRKPKGKVIYNNLYNGTTEMVFSDFKNNGIGYISTDDAPLVSQFNWHIKSAVNGVSYIEGRATSGKHIKLHRFLMNPKSDEIIDHINKNQLDNRRSNLRIATYSENNLNCKFNKLNKTGRTGVYRLTPKKRSSKYVAKLIYNGKTYREEFVVSKYGEEEAFKLACETREKWEKEFNVLSSKTRND